MGDIILKDNITFNIILGNYAVSFMGSYITANLAEQLRLSRKMKPKIMGPTTLLFLMAVSLGGVSIWMEHFTMISADLCNEESGEIFEKSFSVGLTVLSIFLSVLFAFCGLYSSSSDRAFFKSKVEIAKMVEEDAKNLTIQQISKSDSLIILSLSKDLRSLILGGVITGKKWKYK